MRVVFIGVSHWHLILYLKPALENSGVEIVGVSDPNSVVAQAAAERARCKAWVDYREMCGATRPDSAFALGRYCDMAELARFLIEQRIAFTMEKPCGVTTAEVDDIARRARERGVFATPGFVMRLSPVLDVIREAAAGEAIQYASYKFVAGTVQRYRDAGVDWMLHRATAGGGCTLNLGVHFLDLFRLITGSEPTVVGAEMSNATAGLDIEDHGVVLLRSGKAACMVETGYICPAPSAVFDMHFSIRAERHYFVAPDIKTLLISDEGGHHETRSMPTTNMECYPVFVRDVLKRVEEGRPPIANLDDMAATIKLVATAYSMAPLNPR